MFGSGVLRLVLGRPSKVIAVVAMTLGLAACAGPLAFVLRAPVTIATADPSAVYFPIGNAICRMANLSEAADSAKRCRVIASNGAVANIGKVLTGKATFGLTQSDLADGAFRGQGPFAETGAESDLRSVIALHRETFTVLARPDSRIQTFEDLRGRRVGIGRVGAGYIFARDIVLDSYGWTLADFEGSLELGPVEQNRALCEGRVDAIVFEAVHPDGLTQDATSRCQARLVQVAGPPIDRLFKLSYYDKSVVPGGMYENNSNDTFTFGTQAVLVTSVRQPDDLVYALVKDTFENFEDFRRLHPALRSLDRTVLTPSGAVLPIHPGALRYYLEVGLGSPR